MAWRATEGVVMICALALARRRLRVPHRDVVVGIEVRINLVGLLVVGVGLALEGSFLGRAEREAGPRAPRAAAAAAPRDDAGGHGGLEGALLLAVVVACVEINPLSHFSAMTWPRWLRRAVRNRHLHVNLISTQGNAVIGILVVVYLL